MGHDGEANNDFRNRVGKAMADVMAANPNFTLTTDNGSDVLDPEHYVMVAIRHEPSGLAKKFLLDSEAFDTPRSRYTPFGMLSLIVETMESEAILRRSPGSR